VSQYVFDNAAAQAGQRFQSLESLYDPRTVRFLAATGIGPGWRCLEVGAGGGSIAAWLSGHVGPGGQVIVTDIDPRHLEPLAAAGRSNVDVRHHDVGQDPLPEAAFDLIHARLVLIHVPQRETALARLVAALKPGGWIVIEDFDAAFIDRSFPAIDPEKYATYDAMMAVMRQITDRHGLDPVWGRSLYRRFIAHGLVDVGLEGHFAVWSGDSPGARLGQANFQQIRTEAVTAGLVTDAQVDRAIAVLADPGFAFGSPVMMSAWGRKS
jgi:ubiquinone/menaquinone biosynthesis C-methylase UbiE